MDFSEYATDTREVQFVLPNGVKSGFHLTLRYESAPEVQAVHRKFRHKFIEAQRKGKRGNQDKLLDQAELERAIAHVADWRFEKDSEMTWKGERPKFSEQKLREMLDHGEAGIVLKEFITEEVGDASDFLGSLKQA